MSEWWCQYCGSVVQPENVTYDERHDERGGGCGGPVQGGSCAPKQNYDQVICPECNLQFTAIPVNVQERIAGLEQQLARIDSLTAEVEEQARLLGASGSREAKLQARIDAMEKELEDAVTECLAAKSNADILQARIDVLTAAAKRVLDMRRHQQSVFHEEEVHLPWIALAALLGDRK